MALTRTGHGFCQWVCRFRKVLVFGVYFLRIERLIEEEMKMLLKRDYSHWNIFPLGSLPFGFLQWRTVILSTFF